MKNGENFEILKKQIYHIRKLYKICANYTKKQKKPIYNKSIKTIDKDLARNLIQKKEQKNYEKKIIGDFIDRSN